jgi:hypothetical protein
MPYLDHEDFKIILKHYKLSIPKSKRKTRKKAIDVLAKKLCSCINKLKKTRKKYKRRTITALCTSSIFKKRGLVHNRFTCKKKPRLYTSKKNRRYLVKTRKNFNMKYK